MSKKNLMDRSYITSLLITSVIVIAVQMSSLAITTSLRINDVNRKAVLTADEIAVFLTEPMYDLNDDQVLKIAEFLLSSGRVAGISIVSNASGTIIDKVSPKESIWVSSQTRLLNYRGENLGKIFIQYNDSEFIRFNKTILLTTFVLLAGVLSVNYLVLIIFIRNKTRKTFSALTEGIRKVETSNYEYVLPSSGYSDFDHIIDSMNEMSARVRENQAQLLKINAELELRVAERTKKLENSLSELQNMQDRLIESSKLSVLGQLSAGIAHEFNTPLGAIMSTSDTLVDFFDNYCFEQYRFQRTINSEEKKLFDKVFELGIIESKTLTLSDISIKERRQLQKKLADAGISDSETLPDPITDAGIAEKIDELIPYLQIRNSYRVVTEAARPVIARKMIEVIVESGKKASSVISAFHSYLSSETHEDSKTVNIDEDISKVILLLHNDLKKGVKVKTEFSDVQVMGYSDRLSQVWMNIIRNAAQSMKYKGELLIKTEKKERTAYISIIDSGPGIPENIMKNIFDPFFTTRKKGEGMGLGLDICKRIIENHNGSIEVKSKPGRTEFIVKLPLKQDY